MTNTEQWILLGTMVLELVVVIFLLFIIHTDKRIIFQTKKAKQLENSLELIELHKELKLTKQRLDSKSNEFYRLWKNQEDMIGRERLGEIVTEELNKLREELKEEHKAQLEDGLISLTMLVKDKEETILNQRDNILRLEDVNKLLREENIVFETGELDEEVVCAEIAHTTQHGAIEGKTQTKTVKYYNLDVERLNEDIENN